MKFACDSCQTKYTIPDEKVRGKVLKIRCKKCGAVITVKEEVAQAPEPEIEAPPPEERTRVADIGLLEKLRASEGQPTAAVMSAAPAASARAQSTEANEAPTSVKPAVFHEWYAMIGGQQAGPFNHADMEGRVKGGEVTDRTHVWRDGMGDWQRAGEVEELKEFFAPPEPPPPAPAPPPPRPAAPAPMMPASFDDEELPTRLGPRPDLSTLGDAGLFNDESMGDAPAPAEPAPAQEQSSSQNLADLVASDLDQHAAEAAVLGSGPVEMGDPAAQADPFAAVSDAPGVKAPVIGEQTRFFMKKAGVTNRNPWWKYAIYVILVFGIPVGAIYALGRAGVGGTVAVVDANGEVNQVQFFSVDGLAANTGLGQLLRGKKKATAEVMAEAEKKKHPPKAPKPVTGPKPDDAPDRPDARANLTPEEAKKLADAQAALKGAEGTNPFGAIVADPTGHGGGPQGRKDAPKAPAIDGAGGGLSAEQINKVVGDTTPAFNKCVEEELRHNPNWHGGKVTVSLAIKSSGVVSAPSIDKKDVDASAVGECIKTKAKRMVFPRFEGEDQPVEFPLILTNGG